MLQAPTAAPAATPPGQRHEAVSLWRRVLRLFLYQRELTPILITVVLFAYFTIRAGSTFTSSLSLSSAAGYAGPIGAIAVGEVLLLVLAEIDLSAGQVFLFAPWVEYWLHNLGVPVASGDSARACRVLRCRSGKRADHRASERAVLRHDAGDELHPLRPRAHLLELHPGIADPAVGVFLADRSVSFIEPGDGGLAMVGDPVGGSDHDPAHVLLTRTRFGVRIIATGGNLVGAAEAGVPVRRVKVWCFVLCSFFAGLVGIVDAVKYGSLDPGNFGVDYILYAVGACVIGGTALTGGRGTVIGAFIGAILIGVLEDGLTLIGVSTNDFYVWVGVVIIFAMALNVQFDRADRPLEGGHERPSPPSRRLRRPSRPGPRSRCAA